MGKVDRPWDRPKPGTKGAVQRPERACRSGTQRPSDTGSWTTTPSGPCTCWVVVGNPWSDTYRRVEVNCFRPQLQQAITTAVILSGRATFACLQRWKMGHF